MKGYKGYCTYKVSNSILREGPKAQTNYNNNALNIS